jgi:uncharacterized alkaline shock family protein YloU
MTQFLNRFLLFIFSLSIAIIAPAVLLSGLGVLDEGLTLNVVRDVLDIAWLNNTVIIVSFVLFLFALRFLYLSVKVSNPRNRSYNQVTPLGEIRISMDTVENLSLKATGTVRGVKDIKARVKFNQQGLEIAIRIVVDGVHAIPELTEEIQRQVTKEVSEITGIQVSNVSVFVANIIQNPSIKRRVE